MSNPLIYPKLRWPLEVRFEQVQGREILLLRDPMGISEQPLLLIPAIAPLIASLDGTSSINDIVAKFNTIGATEKIVTDLVSLLEANLFLATPAFEKAEREFRSQYRSLAIRAPSMAGGAYAADPHSLNRELDNFLMHANGAIKNHKSEMVALISPHIDYRRGGVCYGKAFHYLQFESPDIYILIGTSHQYSDYLFHLTTKSFMTPIGMLPCNTELVRRVAAMYGEERSYFDEILHKNEHSLELQTPFLRRFANGATIVPILVGGFHDFMISGKSPKESGNYEDFVGALTECLAAESLQGRKICFLAGVDMAHVGRAFGDKGNLTPAKMEEIALRDKIYLDAISSRKKEALFQHIAEDRDARRICGFPTIYTMMDIFDRLAINYTAELFDYRQAVDYSTDCAVTFAGMGLYRI